MAAVVLVLFLKYGDIKYNEILLIKVIKVIIIIEVSCFHLKEY